MVKGQWEKKLDRWEGEQYTTVFKKTYTITAGVIYFQLQLLGFQSQHIFKRKLRDIFWNECGKSAYHVYMQGCAAR